MSFSNKNLNPSSISEKELAEFDAAQRENNRFMEKLADKSRKKGFIESNQSGYMLAKVGYLTICVFYVAFAWPWLAGIVAGHFSYLDQVTAWLFGGLLAVASLAVIEYLRIKNATALLEEHFFHNEKDAKRLFYAALFTLITGAMAILGVPEVLAKMNPAPTPIAASLETKKSVEDSYLAQIAAADKAAAAFYESRSWLGKLSDRDGKTYAKHLNTASTLRQDYSAALKNMEAKNAKALADTDVLNLQRVADHQKQQGGITRTLIFFIVILEGLFWFCFHFKERFEYMAYLEMKLAGGKQTQPQNGQGQGQKQQQQGQQHNLQAPPPPPMKKSESEIIGEAAAKALQKINEARAADPALAVTFDLLVNEMKLATTMNGKYASTPLGGK